MRTLQKNIFFRLLFIVLVATMLSNCFRGNNTGGARATRADWVLDVWTSKKCAKLGDTVIVRATVSNLGTKTESIELPSDPVLDLAINDGQRTVRWSELPNQPADMKRLELGPNESKTIEMQWLVESGVTRLVVEADFIDNPLDSRGPVRAIGDIHVGSCPGTQ